MLGTPFSHTSFSKSKRPKPFDVSLVSPQWNLLVHHGSCSFFEVSPNFAAYSILCLLVQTRLLFNRVPRKFCEYLIGSPASPSLCSPSAEAALGVGSRPAFTLFEFAETKACRHCRDVIRRQTRGVAQFSKL